MIFLWFVATTCMADPGPLEAIRDSVEELIFTEPLTNSLITWGPDPFMKEAGYTSEDQTELPMVLGGIGITPHRRTAVLNGDLVSQGRILPTGEVVAEIGPNYVILKKQNQLREVLFEPENAPAKENESNAKANFLDMLTGQGKAKVTGKAAEVKK